MRVDVQPRELDLYVQKEVGDDDYIDPTEIIWMVDHPDWDRPKRTYGSTGESTTTHVESDYYSPISKSVSVTFGTAFSTIPKTIMLRVYRMKETVTGNGIWKEWDVRYHHTSASWKSTTGFSLTIESEESLTGVIIEYEFK